MLDLRRLQLMELGIVDDNKAHELIQDPYHELPSHLKERQFEVIAHEREARRAENHQKQVQDAAKVFSNPWVLQKEREMFE
jgi:hypothetical protein